MKQFFRFNKPYFLSLLLLLVMTAFVLHFKGPGTLSPEQMRSISDGEIDKGRDIFRYDTFGDEAFWGEKLGLHKTIAGSANGGIGAGLSPVTALALGLKVDAEAIPQDIQDKLKTGQIDLNDPAITLALLKLNAVVGVKGIFEGDKLASIGITCAFCHSTVDNSFAPSIGKRLDGWANRDLNVGAIVAFSADIQPVANALDVDTGTVMKVLKSWGPGKYDAELNLDGKAFQPDGKSAATLIPDAFGLAGNNMHTYTGWGSVTYWNTYVGILQMHGQGRFYDPRLNDQSKFPLAVNNKLWDIKNDPDLLTPKLAALHVYQLSILSPKPPEGTFDAGKAQAGEIIFNTKAKCATCHVPPLYTEPGWNMHKADEIGIDDFQAKRSPDEAYRTTPLKGLWTRMGGFYHDGRFATLEDVISHYENFFKLGLSSDDKSNLVEFLKSLGDVQQTATDIRESSENSLPNTYYLFNNYPNPFNPNTTLEYIIPKAGTVNLKVYDSIGKEVATLVNGFQQAGKYKLSFNAASLSSGVYIYRIESGNFSQTKKMMLIK